MDKSKAAPVPLKWRRQVLPPAPPEDGRPEEPWREGNRSDADSEENVQFVTSRTPSSESEDFLRALPERPDDEYDDAPGRAQLVATLRELLEEEEQSETSQGAQKAETARLPTPPAAPAEDLQVNEEFALEEEFREEENIEHDVNVQLQLDDSLAISAVEDSQQPLQEPAEKRGRLGSALRARAKAFARGRASKTDGKGKKKNKAQAQSPPASLPRANSRLSEMSSASFVFDDDEEEISSESQLKRSFRCFSCRFQCSLSCISFQIYVLALALAVAGAIYMGLEGPEIQLGAFDLWTQVQKPGSQDARYFAFARRSALGLRHALPLGPANASAARQWHSIELFWEMGASEEQKLQDFQPEVISDAYMSRVHAAEAQVQALTGWSSFCNATPAEVQFLCRPGDSLPALAFGTWEAPNFNEQILGMKWKVWFNGQGRGTQIPVETLLTFTREVEPSLLERWLSQGAADSADQEDARRLLRSTFLFYFPSEELPSFLRFVDDELRPFLVQLQDASEEASGGLRGFFRIDGRDLRDLPRYFRHEELSVCTPLITLVAVQLTTRRALLSFGAAAVVAAAVAAAAAAEGRQAPAGILAWPYLAASAVEIAIACSSIISYNRVLMMRLNVLDPKGMKAAFLWRSPWREKCIAWLQMPLQLFAPTLTAVVVLQALSSLASDVPMVQEFAGPALLGMLMILVFGPFLFVPAILLGDAAAERRLFEASGLAQLLPKEIASTPETAAQRRGRRRYALFVATRYSYWLACPTLTVSALILIVIVAVNSQVLLEAETPYLFNSDHIFHRAQEVKAKAGGLPSPDVMAATVLRNASSCQIGADASLQCSWYSCTAQTSVVDLAGLCECDYRLEAAETQCYATARFAGLTEPLEGFWEWANATLASRNTSLKGARLNFATWSLASPLELEDWDSGRNFLQKQIASQLPATAPEDCFEAQCYCGSARCNRTSRWLRLGRLSAPGSNATSDPGAGGNVTETMEVVVVWGDKVGQALDLSSLEAQRQLYAFCAATMPDLEILSRSCWAQDFKLWLEAQGEKFPVPTENFWAYLTAFAADEGLEKYFWYETGVGLVGTFAVFSVPLVSADDAATVRGRWESYLSLRPGVPSQPWLVAEALQVDPAETLQDLGRSMALIVAPVLGVAMCLLGCSVTLGLAAAAATGLGTAVLIACAPLGPQDGVLQLLCLVIFSAASVAPIVRFLLFYSSARNGPGKRVKNEPSEAMDFDRKVPDFTSQPQESLARDERNRFKSMASSEDQHLQELQQRWAQVSADRRELQSTFRAAAISSERKLRSTTALRHSAEILLGYAISAPLCWLMMFLAAPTALSQVARVFIFMACVLPGVTLCGLPILILGGLGPSRVWRQALVAFLSATTGLARRLGGPACSDPELRSPKDDEEEVRRASKVLGWPFTRLGQSWLKRRGVKLSRMAPTEVTPTRG